METSAVRMLVPLVAVPPQSRVVLKICGVVRLTMRD
jgi:hypothetical protein